MKWANMMGIFVFLLIFTACQTQKTVTTTTAVVTTTIPDTTINDVNSGITDADTINSEINSSGVDNSMEGLDKLNW